MTIGLIGAPSSAAGHWPGMEKAPAFLRLSGLPERLREAGAQVVDHGDLPLLRWRVDASSPRAQNLTLVQAYLADLATRVDEAVTHGELPIVVGGECTVTLGVVAALLRHYEHLGVLYMDGHIDLNTPASTSSGILDSMVMSHMFGHEGTTPELRDMGPRSPMLSPADVVYFGYNEGKMNDIETKHLESWETPLYPVKVHEGSVEQLAHAALTEMEARCSHFLLHLDVDVICFRDFPIANVPIHSEGLTFDQAMESVAIFASSPMCVGLVITEINPDHATAELGVRFATGIAEAVRGLVVQP